MRTTPPTRENKAETATRSNPQQPSSSLSLVECGSCRHTNRPDRRFCGQCGDSLWRPCLRCGSEGGGNETFCGRCGANYTEALAAHQAGFADTIERARQLHAAGKIDQAITLLRSLPDVEHAGLRRQRADAIQCAQRWSEERTQRLQDAEQQFAHAQQDLAEHRYQEALTRLQSIPPGDLPAAGRKLLESTEAVCRELKQLRAGLAADVEARRLLQLAPRIDRYLSLQPGDAKIRALAGRVRDIVAARVQDALAAGEYEQAGRLLEQLPLAAVDEPTKPLQSRVREMLRLHTELRTAVHADQGLLAIGRRLAQLAPHDAKVPKLVAELAARVQRGPKDPRFPVVPWAPAGEKTAVGMPVDWVAGFKRLQSANPGVEESLRAHPGAYFVAAGLALQGLGQAAVTINLHPAPEPAGLLGKLSRFRKATPAKVAWGIDLGGSSIKVLKLSAGEGPTGTVTILAADSIPYPRNLGDPAADRQREEWVHESLQSWRDKYAPAADEAVCVNAPSTKLLGRFFRLPLAKPQKIAEMVEFEFARQIPYPLTDLSWGYQVLTEMAGTGGPGEGIGESSPLRPVLVAAMRLRDAQDQLQPFESLGIAIHVLQAESLALHNLLSFDQFGETGMADSAAGEPARLALLDLGSDSSNFVVSSPGQVWFRTLRYGGNDLNQALAREFKLTFTQAEEIKRQLEKARRLGNLLDTIDQTTIRLLSEVQRTLEMYLQEQPGLPISRLWLCGGAAAQFGILRQFRCGSLPPRP